MFPIRDDNPTFHTAVATIAIIGVNIIVWVLLQGMGFGTHLTQSVWTFGIIPGELLGRIPAGTRIPAGQGLIYVVEQSPNWLSLLSHMFMHGGWLHLLGNMWFLWIFGDNVEDSFGTLKFVLFYLICGLAAAGMQILTSPGSAIPMVGASGAIGGVMGAYMVLFPRAPVHMLVILGFYIDRIVVPAWVVLGYWFVLQFISGLPSLGNSTGGVAFWAHVGGFGAGFILTKVFCKGARVDERKVKVGTVDRIVQRRIKR